jgi:hypothetical protein
MSNTGKVGMKYRGYMLRLCTTTRSCGTRRRNCIDGYTSLGVAEMQQLAILIKNVPRVDPPTKAKAIKRS